jgi:hypothetical protein
VNNYPALFFFDLTFVLSYHEDLSYSSLETWVKEYLEDRVKPITPEELTDQQRPYIVIESGADYEIRVLNQSIHGIDIRGLSVDGEDKGKIRISTRNGDVDYHGDIERIELRKWILRQLETVIIQLDT